MRTLLAISISGADFCRVFHPRSPLTSVVLSTGQGAWLLG